MGIQDLFIDLREPSSPDSCGKPHAGTGPRCLPANQAAPPTCSRSFRPICPYRALLPRTLARNSYCPSMKLEIKPMASRLALFNDGRGIDLVRGNYRSRARGRCRETGAACAGPGRLIVARVAAGRRPAGVSGEVSQDVDRGTRRPAGSGFSCDWRWFRFRDTPGPSLEAPVHPDAQSPRRLEIPCICRRLLCSNINAMRIRT